MIEKLIGLPVQAKLILALAFTAFVFGAGFSVSSAISEGEMATMQLAHQKQLNAAMDAQLAAEMIARSAERKAAKSIAAATNLFEEIRQNEKATADRTIADLRNDVKRLRVSIKPAPKACGLPGTPASAGGSDGEAEATLSGSVAARLAGRYADYNALITQLELCQATVEADRGMTAP